MEKAAVATAAELPFLRAQIVSKEKDKHEYVLSSGPWKGSVRTIPWPLEKNGHIEEDGLSELHRIAELELNKSFSEKEHGTPIAEVRHGFPVILCHSRTLSLNSKTLDFRRY